MKAIASLTYLYAITGGTVWKNKGHTRHNCACSVDTSCTDALIVMAHINERTGRIMNAPSTAAIPRVIDTL